MSDYTKVVNEYSMDNTLPGKPFNYERAKAGDPVVDYRGRPVTQLVKFEVNDNGGRPYRGVLNDYITAFRDSELFMAPNKKTLTRFVNLYATDDGTNVDTQIHRTQENADRYGAKDRIGGRAWPVTIEYEE